MFIISSVLTFIIIAFGNPFAPLDATGQPQTQQATPVYSLIAAADRPAFNPGDRVQINLYILGTAPIRGKDNRLVVYIPPVLIKDGSKDETVTLQDFALNHYENDTVEPRCDEIIIAKLPYTFVVELDEYYLLPRKLPMGMVLNSSAFIDCPDGKRYAPFSVSFISSKHAPPGQHNITVKLLYYTSTSSNIAETQVSMNVNSFLETNQPWLSGVLAVLVFFATRLIPTAKELDPWLVLIAGVIFLIILITLDLLIG